MRHCPDVNVLMSTGSWYGPFCLGSSVMAGDVSTSPSGTGRYLPIAACGMTISHRSDSRRCRAIRSGTHT